MLTHVYIDGFNFYYACWKNWEDPDCHWLVGTGPYKWVDFRALAEQLLPGHTIGRVYYFTAKVKGSMRDPNKPQRQELYFRALRTLPQFEIRLGHFEERGKTGRLAGAVPCQLAQPCITAQTLLDIVVREEKGSDVNLATWLLRDAFQQKFEKALVISDDSDLESAVRIVRTEARLPVHVVSPKPTAVKQLRKAADTWAILDKKLIPQAQLPNPVLLPDGTTLVKPADW